MKRRSFWPAIIAPLVGVLIGVGIAFATAPAKHVAKASVCHATDHIYIQDKSPVSWSRSSIKHDIPEWEKAANGTFRRDWKTPSVCISLLRSGKPVPRGGIAASIVNKGPVKDALAYHTSVGGYPKIVVYAGVGDFYGFNNSVSFTHEMFELLADPYITTLNQGWPDITVYLGQSPNLFPYNFDWVREVCDPVEAYAYTVHGVAISDWITQNWFNDHVANQPYDYMGVTSNPYQILKGGYAQFYTGDSWVAVTNFRHTRAARGFFDGESAESGHKVKVLTSLDRAATLGVKRDGG